MTGGAGVPHQGRAALDAVTADDALLDRLARRAPSEHDLAADPTRALAALAADADGHAAGAAPAAPLRPATVHVLPAGAPRRRRRPLVAAAVASTLALSGAGAAAALGVPAIGALDDLRTVVADTTGAQWIRPDPAPPVEADGSPVPPATGTPGADTAGGRTGAGSAASVLNEVSARLGAGDVEAAEQGLARAREVVQSLPPGERGRWSARLADTESAVTAARGGQAATPSRPAPSVPEQARPSHVRPTQAPPAQDQSPPQPAHPPAVQPTSARDGAADRQAPGLAPPRPPERPTPPAAGAAPDDRGGRGRDG